MTQYTYGTGTAAEERLLRIAEFFNPLSREFIRRQVPGAVTTGLDLGCGPGFTTQMLFEALECQRICGLDDSESFPAMARRRFGQGRPGCRRSGAREPLEAPEGGSGALIGSENEVPLFFLCG